MIRILFLCLLALPAGAETLVAARTIPARTIIGPDDLLLRDIATTGGITDPLDRAGPGDLIRVMNLSSRSTVTARVGSDGAAYVSY